MSWVTERITVSPQAKCVRGKLTRPVGATVRFSCEGSDMVIRDDGDGNLIGDCAKNGWISVLVGETDSTGEFYFEPKVRFAETKVWTVEYMRER